MNQETRYEYKKRLLELKKIQLIHRCRTDFFTFVRYMFPFNVSWNWHHKYVANKLQMLAEGQISNLMLFMPPQHQKSTLMSEYLPAWQFGLNPNEQTILTMYNATKAKQYNKKVQRIITNEKYNQIFPNTFLNSNYEEKNDFAQTSDYFEIVNNQGFFYSVGVGGGIAGTPAKTALMDDVIKNHAEAYSKTYREKTYNWYTDELEARLHNDSKVAFTITRRHEDDLAGRLIKRDGTTKEGGKWEVISVPALKEDNSNPEDPRQIGEALFPSLHSKERLEEIRDKSSRTFASLYQQRPAPIEGNIIDTDWFNYFDAQSFKFSKSEVKLYIDGAYTEDENNDPSAIMVYLTRGDRLYILRVFQLWLEAPELLKKLEEIVSYYGHKDFTTITFEPKASGKTLKQLLKKKGFKAREDKAPTESKETRVNQITPFIEFGQNYLPKGESWTEGFLSECAIFPGGRDDQVDCLSAVNRIEFLKANTTFTMRTTRHSV